MSEDRKDQATRLPSKAEIRKFVQETGGGRLSRREIARAFGIRGHAEKMQLKKLLNDMKREDIAEGRPARGPRRSGSLPPVAVIELLEPDEDGTLLARPIKWDADRPPPDILLDPSTARGPAPGAGDRFLARLAKHQDYYIASAIKRLEFAPRKIIGLFHQGDRHGRVVPTDRKAKHELTIRPSDYGGAKTGDVVEVETVHSAGMGPRYGKIVRVLGGFDDPRVISLLSMEAHGIPGDFDRETLTEAEMANGISEPGKRTDLRNIPLVTIDPADARDHDDAIWAAQDDDQNNPGGWTIIVAIADVAHYVRTGSALNRSALERGVSTYFPDRVSPMLPETLSNDLCSLKEGQDRPVMAVQMWLTADGRKLRHQFMRGLMKSHGAWSYEMAQAALDGDPDTGIDPAMVRDVLRPLFGAYNALATARDKREPLALDLPERKVIIGDDGYIAEIRPRERLDTHRLVEDMMIAANVCAAETLEKHQRPCVYRVHDQPDEERVEGLKDFLDSLDLPFNKGQVLHARLFNQVLTKVRGSALEPMVNESVLRSQSQAYYSVGNLGHFGLSLPKYAHFTSPIRRYADLLVHRALIDAHKFGPDGLGDVDREQIESFAEQTSQNERRAMLAERDADDRFTAIFLSDRVGEIFEGRISGVTKYGLFITLHETGASGLVPMRSLPNDYYHVDEQSQMLVGERHGRAYRLGSSVAIRLVEAVPVTGGLTFEMLHGEDQETVDTSKMRLRGPKKKQGRPHRGRRGPRRR